MADSDQGEKTEDPTQQRREDFRKRGQVAQTKELSSLLVVLISALFIWLLGRFFLEQLYQVFTRSFGDYLVAAARDSSWITPIEFAIQKGFLIVAPVAGILMLIAIASSALQVGFLINEEAMQLKFDRIDPIQGFKRVFSIRSLVEGIKAIFKVSIVAAISILILRSELVVVPKLVTFSIEQIMSYVGDVTIKLLGGVGVFLAFLAAIDFMFQKWDLEQKMKMTKQEVKEELKSREGDPLIKARIRRTQREMATRRMMEDVPTADVIITNPTHIAVALKYSENMIAPTIVAKGAGLIAEKIKELAKENNVPIVENKPLARTIYKTIKIGQTIPKELYTAVAEVLSYIFKLRRKRNS